MRHSLGRQANAEPQVSAIQASICERVSARDALMIYIKKH